MSALGTAGAGPNPTRPELLTSKEWRDEVCRLLALGLNLGLLQWPDRATARPTSATAGWVALKQ